MHKVSYRKRDAYFRRLRHRSRLERHHPPPIPSNLSVGHIHVFAIERVRSLYFSRSPACLSVIRKYSGTDPSDSPDSSRYRPTSALCTYSILRGTCDALAWSGFVPWASLGRRRRGYAKGSLHRVQLLAATAYTTAKLLGMCQPSSRLLPHRMSLSEFSLCRKASIRP